MKVDRVTLTGADDSTNPAELFRISEKYPFVEWGILLSDRVEGNNRFPSLSWVHDFVGLYEEHMDVGNKINISGHICGKWVREICKGNWDNFSNHHADLEQYLQRVQLNFHAYLHKVDEEPFIEGLKEMGYGQVIFQLDDINNSILDVAQSRGINAAPLFDLSGGTGVLPKKWPEARDCYCGYAGGLSPANLSQQLDIISESVGDRTIWIDAETHVRSLDDRVFDLNKVERFLEIAEAYVEVD